MLDTNFIIGLMKNPVASPYAENAKRYSMAEMALSSVVLKELYFGFYCSNSVNQMANLERIQRLPFIVLNFDRHDAQRSAALRADLRQLGTPIGPYDLMIAGQALAKGLTVVTNNAREFNCVQGLQVEDWSIAPEHS